MRERVLRADVSDFDGDFADERLSRARLLMSWLLRRPVDTFAALVAAVGVAAILVNALFLQSGPHPAPIFANKPAQPTVSHSLTAADAQLPRARPADLVAEPLPAARPRVEPAAASAPAQPKPAAAAPARRNDPIANLLAANPRLIAVQRALSSYGYGQIKPTGLYDPETRAAIERFERERKLPVTGQISDRLTRELTALTGRPLE